MRTEKDRPKLEYVDRRGSDSSKWSKFGPNVLPLWVADMDFKTPDPILRALQERVSHGVFGYGGQHVEMALAFCGRLQEAYGWHVEPQELVFLPGLVCGLNVVCAAVGEHGDSVMTLEPVYPPFLHSPSQQGRHLQSVRMALSSHGKRLRYAIDWEACEAARDSSTRLFLLCNPHNPVGRSFERKELERLAEFCDRNGIVICSDEIHCELLLGNTAHTPIASLDPDIGQRTITLMAPSKTFNIPGLGCSVAVVQNPELRAQVTRASIGIVPHVNLLGITAGTAAYGDPECRAWLDEANRYLTANRDFVLQETERRLPLCRATFTEATYLAWIDCSAYVRGSAQEFFLHRAGLAFGPGNSFFTSGGENFIRVNMGTSRSNLAFALDRMEEAVAGLNDQDSLPN